MLLIGISMLRLLCIFCGISPVERFAYCAKQNEWCQGLKALKVDSLTKLKKVLPDLEKEVPFNFIFSNQSIGFP